jgi:hypothetical protein
VFKFVSCALAGRKVITTNARTNVLIKRGLR